MTVAGPFDAVLGILAALAAAIMVLTASRHVRSVTRAPSGRPYVEVVRDLYEETARRAHLLAVAASARDARLTRLERR